eukprot:6209573-Pleurochrysis_carterae.AAC.1
MANYSSYFIPHSVKASQTQSRGKIALHIEFTGSSDRERLLDHLFEGQLSGQVVAITHVSKVRANGMAQAAQDLHGTVILRAMRDSTARYITACPTEWWRWVWVWVSMRVLRQARSQQIRAPNSAAAEPAHHRAPAGAAAERSSPQSSFSSAAAPCRPRARLLSRLAAAPSPARARRAPSASFAPTGSAPLPAHQRQQLPETRKRRMHSTVGTARQGSSHHLLRPHLMRSATARELGAGAERGHAQGRSGGEE